MPHLAGVPGHEGALRADAVEEPEPVASTSAWSAHLHGELPDARSALRLLGRCIDRPRLLCKPWAVTEPQTKDVRVGGVALDLERLTYATVVVMAVLAAYQGWARLSFLPAALVVLSPVVAVCLAHAFSELLQEHAAHQRTLTRAEWAAAARRQVHLLLAALPPLVILTIGRAASIEVERTGAVVELTGMVTLIFLSAIACRRAGLRGWQLILGSLAGGLVGLAVIALQIALKPH